MSSKEHLYDKRDVKRMSRGPDETDDSVDIHEVIYEIFKREIFQKDSL